ncbi:LacI family DNA-binding transcriptional regulator [uncultured Clostridium sp.]|uniref:LacI family DNA-binding transcriptional regulator n=1 Tax=uncultured Clostridium sp. TaxID=59620 RepID=UPI0028F1738F|nr:LacI family DNA-binding transcriptional regulator [uncultured Clostridium sp.]
MSTIKDIAKRAGVSISTVSNALNGMGNVGEETKNKILQIAKEINYIPNINAKLLRNRKTNNIGLFLPNVIGQFYYMLIQAMYAVCKREKYALKIFVCDFKRGEKLTSSILSSNIDGAVILHEGFEDCQLKFLKDQAMKFVFLDKNICSDNISSILINNEQGIIQGVDYLISSKHKKIAYMRGTNNYDSIVRFNAFKKAMNKYSMNIDESLILSGYFEEAAAYNAIRAAFLHRVEFPDAILCENDDMARGCIQALNDLNKRVPEDVSIIGFDDTDFSKHCNPPLTTIHSPINELGEKAVQEILRLLKPNETGLMNVLNTRLVIRNSCIFRENNFDNKY